MTAVQRAVDAIDAALGARGQWPGEAVLDAPPWAARRDLAAPLTALGMLLLHSTPGAEGVLARSVEHLERTVLPDGLWRYYADIPSDLDDTAMCALALGSEHPIVRERTVPALVAARRPDGLFPTWQEPGWQPVVDAVANANIVAAIGADDVVGDAVTWLTTVVDSEREVESSAYYRDPLDLHLAIARAVAAGVVALRPALEQAAGRAATRLRSDPGLSDYRVAQAALVAASVADADAVARAAGRLRGAQDGHGRWSADTLFVAAHTDGPGWWHYRSWTVTTAACARVLSLADEGEG